MLLRVDIEDRVDHAVVTAAGEIDAATADTLATAVSGALDDGYTQVLSTSPRSPSSTRPASACS